jgi:hypothetical protein
VQRLHELDWIDGRTIAVEYRWAEGRYERATEIAAEFVQRKVDVIVTSATAGPISSPAYGGDRSWWRIDRAQAAHDNWRALPGICVLHGQDRQCGEIGGFGGVSTL